MQFSMIKMNKIIGVVFFFGGILVTLYGFALLLKYGAMPEHSIRWVDTIVSFIVIAVGGLFSFSGLGYLLNKH